MIRLIANYLWLVFKADIRNSFINSIHLFCVTFCVKTFLKLSSTFVLTKVDCTINLRGYKLDCTLSINDFCSTIVSIGQYSKIRINLTNWPNDNIDISLGAEFGLWFDFARTKLVVVRVVLMLPRQIYYLFFYDYSGQIWWIRWMQKQFEVEYMHFCRRVHLPVYCLERILFYTSIEFFLSTFPPSKPAIRPLNDRFWLSDSLQDSRWLKLHGYFKLPTPKPCHLIVVFLDCDGRGSLAPVDSVNFGFDSGMWWLIQVN